MPLTARPPHLRAEAVALVVFGGVFGAAAREAIEEALSATHGGFPTATFLINLAGAFILGLLLEALVRSGADVGWRRQARLAAGTGFCGAFTTYSTLAVETVQLARHGAWSTAGGYVVASVVGGLVFASLGVVVGSVHSPLSRDDLPVDPDVDPMGSAR